MPDDPVQWPVGSGMIIDVKGIHVYNRGSETAFSLSYGHIHHWTGGPSGGANQWAKAPKEVSVIEPFPQCNRTFHPRRYANMILEY